MLRRHHRIPNPALAGALLAVFVFGGIAAEAAEAVKQEGAATVYSDRFQGKKTATGERFDQRKKTAASSDLPLGSRATVTNRKTGQSVEVEITDRKPRRGNRIIDLSQGAAKELGLTKEAGTAPVVVEVKPEAQPTPALRKRVEEKAAAAE